MTRELLMLALPLILSNLAYSLLGIVDTLYMGRIGEVELGAVGLSWMYVFSITLLFRSLLYTVTTFVAREYGANNPTGMREWYGKYLNLSLWIGIPLMLLGPYILQAMIAVVKPDPEVAKAVYTYGVIRLWETPLALFAIVNTGYFIGIGNSRLPMMLTWLTVFANAAISYVLVFPLGLGIAGAAWGTFAAVALQALLSFYYLHKELGSIPLARLNFSELKRILKLGLPVGLADFSEVTAFAVLLSIISRLGPTELAASQIANQLSSFGFMPAFALSAATSSLVSRYLGAKDPNKASQVGWLGAWVSAGIMLMIALCFVFFPEALIRLFTDRQSVVPLGVQILGVMSVYMVIDGIGIVLGGALSGAGDTRFRMMVALIGAWLVMVVPAYYLTEAGYGVRGAWFAGLMYIIFVSVLYVWRFRQGKWKLRNI